MATSSRAALLWAPRILGGLVCLFLSLFALDAFAPGAPLRQSIPAFLIHVAPMAILLGTVALSWRRPWLGGLVFSLAAVAYAWTARAHPAWVAVVAGPLLLVGVLFVWSWVSLRQEAGA
jgi:hypothetical protein